MTITDDEFALLVCATLGSPDPSRLTRDKLVAVMVGEGTAADYNPMATGRVVYNDAGDFNDAGVRNFRTVEQGVYATVETLTNGYYNNELAVLFDDSKPLPYWAGVWDHGRWGTRDVAHTVTQADRDRPVGE